MFDYAGTRMKTTNKQTTKKKKKKRKRSNGPMTRFASFNLRVACSSLVGGEIRFEPKRRFIEGKPS